MLHTVSTAGELNHSRVCFNVTLEISPAVISDWESQDRKSVLSQVTILVNICNKSDQNMYIASQCHLEYG